MPPPCIYTPEMGQEICTRLSEGETLVAICKSDHLPTAGCIYSWLVKKHEDGSPLALFVDAYARAREAQALKWSEEIVSISDEGNPEDIQRAKLRVDTRKFLMGKVLPRVFGDSVAITGAGGGPIETKGTGGRDLARRVAMVLAGVDPDKE